MSTKKITVNPPAGTAYRGTIVKVSHNLEAVPGRKPERCYTVRDESGEIRYALASWIKR